MGGNRERVAGVVIEPVEDFHMGAVGQPPVSEVGRPAFVGLFGGKPGTTGRFDLNPQTNHARTLRSKGLDTLEAGDLVSLQLPGAGGYGDPLARDLAAIERDLADGKVTIAAAETDYAVVVNRATLTIDREATRRLRAEPTRSS